MQFLTGLFGGSEGAILNAVLALGIVLVLIILGLWMLKALFRASNNVGKGKNRRLSVVDSIAVDTKRQLLIVRRDDVEHLILVGGPQDVVVETGIPAEPAAVRAPARRPAPAAQKAEPATAAATAATAQSESASKIPSPKLRELAAAPQPQRSTSLRHTGFMRAGNDAEAVAIPVNGDSTGADSARTSHPDGEQAAAGENSDNETSGSSRKADSN